jgi:hypothetical protein
MAHYAFLDDNNIVTEVIVGIDETELIEGKEPETWYSKFRNQRCVRTSYNGSIRTRFAGVGFVYNEDLDAFLMPRPFASWSLDEQSASWVPPIPYPDDNIIYTWNEELLDWEAVIHDNSSAE